MNVLVFASIIMELLHVWIKCGGERGKMFINFIIYNWSPHVGFRD